MSAPIIRVENLSKQYKLGLTHTDLFSERLGNSLRSIVNRFKRGNNPPSPNSNPSSSTESSDSFWALKDVSFEINEGEVLGIIGRNGAGKSTLLKILSRITSPTSGRVEMYGRVASLLEVGTGFHPELTGKENIYLNGVILGMSKQDIRNKFDEIVAFAGVEKFVDTPVKRYSSGMYVRLAFAVAAHLESEILLVDEVLAVGDAQFQRKCIGKMNDLSSKGRTVLFVSHNMGIMESICSHGVYLKSSQIEYAGSIEQTINNYLSSFLNNSRQEPGILFNASNVCRNSFQIINVSILDKFYNPISNIRTGDYLRIRIQYYSPEYISKGSVNLELFTLTGTRLIHSSTYPLCGIELSFSQGESHVECIFPRFPLASGSYRIGVGLAIPNTKWLCHEDNLSPLEVTAKDIYGSKFPPIQEYTLVAVDHFWHC